MFSNVYYPAFSKASSHAKSASTQTFGASLQQSAQQAAVNTLKEINRQMDRAGLLQVNILFMDESTIKALFTFNQQVYEVHLTEWTNENQTTHVFKAGYEGYIKRADDTVVLNFQPASYMRSGIKFINHLQKKDAVQYQNSLEGVNFMLEKQGATESKILAQKVIAAIAKQKISF